MPQNQNNVQTSAKCGLQTGTHTQIFLVNFWKDVFDALREVFHHDPNVVLLGVIPDVFEGKAKITEYFLCT